MIEGKASDATRGDSSDPPMIVRSSAPTEHSSSTRGRAVINGVPSTSGTRGTPPSRISASRPNPPRLKIKFPLAAYKAAPSINHDNINTSTNTTSSINNSNNTNTNSINNTTVTNANTFTNNTATKTTINNNNRPDAGNDWDADQDGPPPLEAPTLSGEHNKSTAATTAAVAAPATGTGGEMAWIMESLRGHAKKGTEPPTWMVNLAMLHIGGLPVDYSQT